MNKKWKNQELGFQECKIIRKIKNGLVLLKVIGNSVDSNEPLHKTKVTTQVVSRKKKYLRSSNTDTYERESNPLPPKVSWR